MTPEITALTLAGLLQVVQFVMFSVAANLQLTPKQTLGNRDQALTLTGKPARLQRAFLNHFESLALFTIAVVVVTLGDAASPFTAICGYVYVAARVFYIPAYVYGLTPWRSLIWMVAFAAIVVMLLAALTA